MKDLTLVMTCCDRLSYTIQTLESLSKCDGVENINLYIFCEPHGPDVIRYINTLHFCNIKVFVNPRRYGHTKNTHVALTYGFRQDGDYVVLIEDDQVFAKDFLKLHRYYKDKYRDDKQMFTVTAGHYINCKHARNPEDLYTYSIIKSMANQGWGTWIDRWSECVNNWEVYEDTSNGKYILRYKHDGWDNKLNKHIRGERYQALPYYSRVYNIGVRGVHCTKDIYNSSIALTDWAGNFDLNMDEKFTYRNIAIGDGMDITPEHGEYNLYNINKT
jgi:hypothetical protein